MVDNSRREYAEARQNGETKRDLENGIFAFAPLSLSPKQRNALLHIPTALISMACGIAIGWWLFSMHGQPQRTTVAASRTVSSPQSPTPPAAAPKKTAAGGYRMYCVHPNDTLSTITADQIGLKYLAAMHKVAEMNHIKGPCWFVICGTLIKIPVLTDEEKKHWEKVTKEKGAWYGILCPPSTAVTITPTTKPDAAAEAGPSRIETKKLATTTIPIRPNPTKAVLPLGISALPVAFIETPWALRIAVQVPAADRQPQPREPEAPQATTTLYEVAVNKEGLNPSILEALGSGGEFPARFADGATRQGWKTVKDVAVTVRSSGDHFLIGFPPQPHISDKAVLGINLGTDKSGKDPSLYVRGLEHHTVAADRRPLHYEPAAYKPLKQNLRKRSRLFVRVIRPALPFATRGALGFAWGGPLGAGIGAAYSLSGVAQARIRRNHRETDNDLAELSPQVQYTIASQWQALQNLAGTLAETKARQQQEIDLQQQEIELLKSALAAKQVQSTDTKGGQ